MSYDSSNVLVSNLYNALDDAIEGMEQMLPYVDEYYAMKHDLLSYIERAKTSLSVAQEAFSQPRPADIPWHG